MTERFIPREHPLTQGRTEEEYTDLSGLELLERDISTQRLERVPVADIVLDAGVVDEGHVRSLARSIKGPRGQISPMTLRARYVGDSRIHYDVIDGFHRAYALIELGREFCHSTVLYGCSEEELFDLRVLAANSVRSVQFARVARWMQHSFSLTEWAKKGLSLSQTFALEAMDTTHAYRLGLSPEETQEVRRWVREKADIWQRPVTTIWDTMRAVDAAAPDLILNVRVGGGGPRSKRGELSPARFKAIVYPLAGEHELQRKVARVVTERNLTADSAGELARAVGRVKDDSEKVNSILKDPTRFLSWDYVPTRIHDTSSRVEVGESPLTEWEVQRALTGLVRQYKFSLEEESELSMLVDACVEADNQAKLKLILSDPLFFVGGGKESEIIPEKESSKRKVGRAKPEPNVGGSDVPKDKKLSFEEMRQQLSYYQEIIKQQSRRIAKLEENIRVLPRRSAARLSSVVLLERPWGRVKFDTSSGQVGSEEVGFISLTPRQKDILRELVAFSGITLDTPTIVLLIGDHKFLPSDENLLWSTISRLRQRLERVSPLLAVKLKTLRGHGYMWE